MRYKNIAKESTNGREKFYLVQCFVNRDFSSVQTAVSNTHVIRSGVCAETGTYPGAPVHIMWCPLHALYAIK